MLILITSAQKNLKKQINRMREEYNLREEKISKQEWDEDTLEMLNNASVLYSLL